MSAASTSPTPSLAPSPQHVAAKSSRVCLNCRRKKKRCDKGLPSCSRCIESRQICQHEDDLGLGSHSSTPGPHHRYELPMGQFSTPGQQPLGGGFSTLNPSLFATMDALEDIHHYVFRTLLEVTENRHGVDNVINAYFRDVNTWFTVLQQAPFKRQVDDMWVNPSAETALLVLCMRLIIRPPNANPFSGMADRHYLIVKTMLSIVQSKVPLSIPLLQAELLIALYEFSHAMPQQVYMSVGNCFQMSRAFGWHNKAFWSLGPQSMGPRELKLCSILWWAIVYVDCLINVAYQDQKYPIHTSIVTSELAIPFPEAFDQYLPGSLSYDFHNTTQHEAFGYLDPDLEQIDGVAWPEAQSAGYLSSVLQQLSGSSPQSVSTRNTVTEMIMGHTIHMLGSKRTTAVGTNFIAMMKLNQPGLLLLVPGVASSTSNNSPLLLPARSRATTPAASAADPRSIETIRSVVDSVCNDGVNLTMEQAAALTNAEFWCVSPIGAFAACYACLILISHGDGVLHDPEWLLKVESLKKTMKSVAQRWTVAGRYLESVDIALTNRLGGYVP